VETVGFPAWEPHPDVFLLVGLLAASYAVAIVRIGPTRVSAGQPVVTRFQVGCFASALAALLVASAWPVHDLGEGYLFSVHMVQHLLYSLVAAPLLLLGTPAWLARALLAPPWLLGIVRWLTRFFVATIVFNVVVVVTHVPAVVDASLRSGLTHFGVHTLVLLSSLVVWMPLCSPLPEVPRFPPLLRMVFLFLQSVVPTVPASFLTFGERPLYRFYEDVPRVFSISALDDMRFAGLVMKIGAGTVLWVIIAIVFFRWYSAEEARTGPPRARGSRASAELDRELMGLTP
jgi:putative membrane protein